MKYSLIFLLFMACMPDKHEDDKKADKNIVTFTFNKKVLNDTKIAVQESFPVTKNDIVFLGDSKTESFPTQEMFNDLHIKNRGIASNTTEDVLSRLEPIISGHPKKIFIEIGINDLSEGSSPEQAFNNIEKIYSRIHSESPETAILAQSILPTTLEHKALNPKIILLNSMIKKYCVANNINYVDLHSHFLSNGEMNKNLTYDGIHLNIEGYRLWKSLLLPYL